MSDFIGMRTHRSSPRTRASRQRGMSMIESLVAMLILAFGVLGMVGVQIRGMVDSQNSAQITVATQLANDLFERIKTNPSANYLFNANFSASDPLNAAQWGWLGNYAFAWGAAAPATTKNCETNFCNAGERASWDVARWKESFALRIPGGDSRVLVSPDDARQMIVIIGWPRKEGSSASPYVGTIPGVTLPSACSSTHTCHFIYGHP